MALFVTFEGGEGAGKDTQANILIERLRKQKKWKVFYAQEPGTTLLGRMLREWLRERNRPLTLFPEEGTQLTLIETASDYSLPDIFLKKSAPHVELLAFIIARTQLTEDYIKPRLQNKNIVICNRYADSTVAYQGYGKGLDLDLIEFANKIATKGLTPDLTILLDQDPKFGLARKWGNTKDDHFESAELNFHQRVREGYLEIAAKEPGRWLVIDATQTKEEIQQIIWQRITQIISSHSGDINTEPTPIKSVN